jgi:hypothetical protein
MITRFFRRTAVAALCLGLLAALLVLTSGQAQTGWQWYTVDI